MRRTKDPSSSSIQPVTHLHSPAITQTKKARPLTAEEILKQASGDVQDSHWDAIVDHIVVMGTGE